MKTILQVPPRHQIARDLKRILLPRGIRCPRCRRRYSQKVGRRYWCKKCRYKFSWEALTFLKGAKLSLKTIWLLLHCWVGELSFEDTEHLTGLSHVTIRRWYRRFTDLIPATTQRTLTGVVEADEAFIGKRRYGNQQIVVGAIERGGEVVLEPIPDREQGTLDRFLLAHVETTSRLFTDAYSGYENLHEFFGYNHEICNHSLGHLGPTNLIENVWMCLRRFIRKVYHHVWKEHLPRILREFQARRSHREAFVNPLSFLQFCTFTVPTQLD